VEATISELTVVATERSTTVASPNGVRVATVEHLFAALAGLAVYDGIVIDVDGPELPLLDGGAAAWCEAIDELEPETGRRVPRCRVARAGTVDVGSSRYELAPADAVRVEARVLLGDARLTTDASWAGDARDFRARIAPARTFAREADIDALALGGLARHVEPSSVVVLAQGAIHHAGRPFSPDEPARHKLLDLVGDLYLCGGPPLGVVRALRPGHGANAAAVARAFAEGLLVPA
jgi:UDP-3-O-[3-hydroxymyristoyl] N-acetylglucosamine deacetylase